MVNEAGVPTEAPPVAELIVTVQLVAPLSAFTPTAWSLLLPSPQETKDEPSWQLLDGETETFAFTEPAVPPVRENHTMLFQPLCSSALFPVADTMSAPAAGGGVVPPGGVTVPPEVTHPTTWRL